MFYLNDVPKGGETCFPLSDIKVTPEAGTLVTWPAGWPWVHNAEIPRSNDKYIITSWMCANWWYDLELKDGVNENGESNELDMVRLNDSILIKVTGFIGDTFFYLCSKTIKKDGFMI